MKWIIISAVAVIFVSVSFNFLKGSKNNVCKTFGDYYSNRDNNKNCYHNPDYNLSVPEMIQRQGYSLETHRVTTEDGYILTVFRIPNGKDLIKRNSRKPVFIQHGLGTCSVCFVSRGSKSLAFILADKGYDVWLGNFRGTRYSQNHTHMNSSASKFWDFSFHENGIYDIPAQLDLVYNITKEKIIYIGYSMGATAMYIYQDTYPETSSKTVDIFINLAPAVFLDQSKTIVKYAFPLWYLVEPLLRSLNNGGFHGKHSITISQEIFDYICFPFPFQMNFCYLIDNIIFGFNYEQNDPETLPISLRKVPDYTSVKSLTHFIQLFQSKDFQRFDYGRETNRRLYGCSEPPPYNLSNAKIPTYFIRSENDLIVTKDNVERLYNSLPEESRTHEIHVVENKDFNHYDFVLAKDVVSLLYDHLVNFLRKQ